MNWVSKHFPYLLFKYSVVITVSVFICSCSSKKNKPLFRDLTSDESGIKFSNNLSNSDSFNIVDFLYYYDGGGVAIGDIDNDGLSDIYLSSNEGKNALYLNKGDLKFEDITFSAGVTSEGPWKAGISMADVNGDGYLDIYICRLGNYKWVKGHNELYINQGNLTFREESAKYNLDFSGYSNQAAFFDMDNDGDLDVYLLNHSVHTARSFGSSELRNDIDSLAGDRLMRNDNNYFVDVSAESGIYRSQIGYGLGVGLTDINQDGFTDIYISNDFLEGDYFYINNGNGSFSESYSSMTGHTSLSSMGNDLADFNNDGLVDIMTLDMLPADESIRKRTMGDDPHEIFRMKISMGYMKQYNRNVLQLNRGDEKFSEIAMLAGIYATDWSWSPLFADFNNDGNKDMFISNGIVKRPNDLNYIDFIEREDIKNNPQITDQEFLDHMPEGEAHNYFFENNNDLTFIDRSSEWGTLSPGLTNGVAYADLDNDGDLDLVLNNLNTLSFIKENQANHGSTQHFLNLEVMGDNKNTKSIGTKTTVFINGSIQYYELYPVRGFKSSVDQRIHVGLGAYEKVDSIYINWPGGKVLRIFDVVADQFLKVEQSKGSFFKLPLKIPAPMFREVKSSELGVDYTHEENTFIEFNRESLIPHMNSIEGPALAIGDVNNDGLDDFYIGGAKYQGGALYLQTSDNFILSPQSVFVDDRLMEDVDAVFFDFEKDGDLDLLAVSGGNEFSGEDVNRQPRLYLNDGSGSFTRKTDMFHGIYLNGSVAAVCDFNSDGWDDIFLGSQTIPWNYGITPKCFLLKNESGRDFTDVSEKLPSKGLLGMINDALWADLDGNSEKDLVLAGEWMNIQIIYQKNGIFTSAEIENSSGWWKSIESIDIDNDGDLDLIGGNLGLNSKLRASNGNPLRLYVNDFDKNGKLDQLLTYYRDGKESIFSPMKDLVKQVPSLTQRFNSGREFSVSTPADLFGKGLKNAIILQANEMRSGVFINESGKFLFQPFPNINQIGWIQDILIRDIDRDGNKDILTGGNTSASTVLEGWYDADYGTLILNQPEGLKITENRKTGLFINGEVRSIKTLVFQGRTYIVVARNNDTIQWFLVGKE